MTRYYTAWHTWGFSLFIVFGLDLAECLRVRFIHCRAVRGAWCVVRGAHSSLFTN